MICPTCRAENEGSIVREGESLRTLMMVNVFNDEEGQWHSHDPNATTTEYTCSRGHSWVEKTYRLCWCGWDRGDL